MQRSTARSMLMRAAMSDQAAALSCSRSLGQTSQRTGVGYGLAGALLSAAVFLLGKGALSDLSPLELVTWVYMFSALHFFAYRLVVRKRESAPSERERSSIASSLWIGCFDLIFNLALFSALRTMTSAEHGFCSLLTEVVAVVMGILFLRERYSGLETLWIVLISFGIVIVQFKPIATIGPGLCWIVIAAGAAGMRSVLAKRALDSRTPSEVALVRTALVAGALLSYAWLSGTLRVPSGRVLTTVIAMSVIGPLISRPDLSSKALPWREQLSQLKNAWRLT
jgi:drug/metabolite transporter (DMT)-like permease